MHHLRHTCIRGAWAAVILLLAALASACGGNATGGIMVSVSPTSTGVALQGTTQFFATVTNATDTTVTWQVNGVTGGNSTCGTISTNGLYTAPSTIPTSTMCAGNTNGSTACTTTTNGTTTPINGCVLITAISNQNANSNGTAAVVLISGVTITVVPTGTATMGTGETLKFIATVTGSSNRTVNWLVNGTQGGSSTNGTITNTTTGDGTLANAAVYTAPATAPSPGSVTITAQSAADTSQTQVITVAISTATAPTLSSAVPLQIPAGAFAEDVYLNGTNFLSTTTVRWSGTDLGTVSGASVTAVNSILIRARIPATLLTTPGTFTVTVEQQNPQQGMTPPSQSVQVVPVRPVLLGALPIAPLVQNAVSSTVELSGGYFTPATTAEWNGHVVPVSPDITFPRALQATLGAGDLSTAGLYSIAVRTPSAARPRSAIDLPVRPSVVPAVLAPISGFSQSNGISGGPVAVAVNDVSGVAVIVDQGMNTLDLLNTGYTAIASQVAVGTMPTSVAVDGLRNLALVTDTGSNDLAVVDLSGPSLTTTLPCVGTAPVAVGVDEIHGRALVVNQNGTGATILDTAHPMACPVVQAIGSIMRAAGTVTATFASPVTIPGGNGGGIITLSGVSDSSFNGTFVVLTGSGTTMLTWSQAGADASSSGGSAATGSVVGTVTAATGTQPQVGILPQMGWAIVTPGNSGTLTVVDLVHSTVVFTASITSTTRGIAVNTETKTALLAEPSSPGAFFFSLLDQSITSVATNVGNVAAAVNPFTNVGVFLNPGLQQALVVDLSTPSVTSTLTLGHHPIAAAIDAATDQALVIDDMDGTVTVVDLGPTRSRLATPEPQILQVSPMITMASSSPVPITVVGAGFACPGSQLRVEETAIPITSCSTREITGTIPVSFLTGPRRLVVDVMNSSTAFSNVRNVLVGLAIAVGNSPAGIAVDQDNDRAVVANSFDGTASVIDISPTSLTFGSVTSTVTVGNTPLGVGIVSRIGFAVVSNAGSSTASVIDMTTNPVTVPVTVPVGAEPTGVGTTESLGYALVTNTVSSSVDMFLPNAGSGLIPSALGIDPAPVAVAAAPDLNVAVTAHGYPSNEALLLDISSGSPAFVNRSIGISNPLGVDYDPATQLFLILASGGNSVLQLNPSTLSRSALRTGVDPTSLAYNFQAGMLVTQNSGSNSLSVVDLPASAVRDVLPISGGPLYAVALHRRLEFMLVSDSANNQVLLFPFPR